MAVFAVYEKGSGDSHVVVWSRDAVADGWDKDVNYGIAEVTGKEMGDGIDKVISVGHAQASGEKIATKPEAL